MRSLLPTLTAFVVALALLSGWPAVGAASGAAYAQTALARGLQEDSTALDRVENAFRAGSAEALLDGAADRLDVIIFGKGASYSRSQAVLVLTDFFRRHPPREVMFEQEVLAEDRRSMIGEYWVTDRNVDPVAVFVRLRARGDRWQLRSIRIERSGGRH